ncbi:hypothetical protein, partial [Klebsiella pneumoniae]|uniref:hypothetical protein n=1 Tax=Klebsiella pneumoniae TaxID=573 RepID=UPI0040559BE8
GFQHLANTEQTGFPRQFSLDSLEEASNPLTSVSDLTPTPEEREIVKRVGGCEAQEEDEERPDDRVIAVWDQVKELSSKVPCSLQQIISDKAEDSWKDTHRDSLKIAPSTEFD